MKRIIMKCPFIKGPEQQHQMKRDYYDPFVELDLHVAQATKDLQECRELILSHSSIAIAAEQSIHDFSQSRKSISSFLLQWKVTSENDELNKALKKMGNSQKELHILAEKHRSHLSRTMSAPSECLLNQLQMVEDIKKQCEEIRLLYQQLKLKREKRKSRNSKVEVGLFQQFQTARDEYYKCGSIYVYRCKCLKEALGQTIVTESIQNFSAEISFFKKASFLYEMIAEDVQHAFEQHYIGCQLNDFSKGDDSDNGGSLEYRTNPSSDESSSLQKSMEKSKNYEVSKISKIVEVRTNNSKELTISSPVNCDDTKNDTDEKENVHDHTLPQLSEAVEEIKLHPVDETKTKISEMHNSSSLCLVNNAEKPLESIVLDKSISLNPTEVRKITNFPCSSRTNSFGKSMVLMARDVSSQTSMPPPPPKIQMSTDVSCSFIMDCSEKSVVLNANENDILTPASPSPPKFQISVCHEILRSTNSPNQAEVFNQSHGSYPCIFDGSSILKGNMKIQMMPRPGLSLFTPAFDLEYWKEQVFPYSRQPKYARFPPPLGLKSTSNRKGVMNGADCFIISEP